jgi:hypothetical protein
MGQEVENSIRVIKIVFTSSDIKETVFAEPLEVACGTVRLSYIQFGYQNTKQTAVCNAYSHRHVLEAKRRIFDTGRATSYGPE